MSAMRWWGVVVVFACATCGPGREPVVTEPSPPLASVAAAPADPASVDAGVPDDVTHWIDRLEHAQDDRERERAVVELQRLGHPAAIEALIGAWRADRRSMRVLKVIIELAAKAGYTESSEWWMAANALAEAAEDFDPGDNNAIERSIMASDAIGRAGDVELIPVLINVVRRRLTDKNSPAHRARIAAMRAIGELGGAKGGDEVLIDVLSADPADQRLELFVAAVDALGTARSARAVVPLIKTMVSNIGLFQQVRRALVAIGPDAIPPLVSVVQGTQAELEELAVDLRLNVSCPATFDGSSSIPAGPDTDCQGPSQLAYFAASVLGDLRAGDDATLAALRAELSAPAKPAFFTPSGPGPTSHEAVLIALGKIGADDPDTLAAVAAYWQSATHADDARARAIETYSYLTAGDATARQKLGELVLDERVDRQVRATAAAAFARGAYAADDLTMNVPRRYKRDRKARARPLDFVLSRSEDSDAELYERLRYALAHAQIGVHCQHDVDCYVEILDGTTDLEAIVDAPASGWTDEQAAWLATVAAERALVELMRSPDGARAHFDTVLALVGSTERAIREPMLTVMARSAELPCEACVKRLNEVVEAHIDNSALRQLTVDTLVVRNYFTWAGHPQSPSPDSP